MNWFIILILLLIIPFIIHKLTIRETETKDVNELYDLLQIVMCELDKSKTEYIITGGTLLGAVRHGGLIPWDDDADLAILNKDINQLLNILKPLEDLGIISYEHYKGNVVVVKFKESKISLDLFLMRKYKNVFNDEEMYKYLFPFNMQYPNEWFYEHELYPLKQYIFGPLIIPGPNNYENFLNRTYNNWQTVASKWNHESYGKEDEETNIFLPLLPSKDFELRKCDLN